MKRLIVTGDDFGLTIPINEAIERAHTNGILTAASLMVASPAAADAIERARRLPSLKVGLHVVVVQTGDLFRPSVRFFFSRTRRAQLESEIRAQFELYRQSGLPLDHVDAHKHMHHHPTVFSTILRVGREYGMRAIRIPHEPFIPSWRASRDRFLARLGWGLFLYPWRTVMRLRARRARLATNDAIFGMNDTGHMTTSRVLRIIEELPDGVSEIYFHPAAPFEDDELAALINPEVAAALRVRGVERITFTDLA